MLIRIRRHINGKYYDLTNSCYISLWEIKEEILSGNQVRVTTCDRVDITSDTLSRIRLEQLKTKSKNQLIVLIQEKKNGDTNQIQKR